MKHSLVFAAAMLTLVCGELIAASYEVVLRGGRVIDPESGRDGVYELGISSGRIAAISEERLQGNEVLDVAGLVVAPGFIDLHNHSPTPLGLRYQALDGVTTSLELEVGAFPVSGVGRYLGQGAPIHYGASAGHLAIRQIVMGEMDTASQALSSGKMALEGAAFHQVANPEQIQAMREYLVQAIDHGALGIGLPLDYISSAVDEPELRMVFELASAHNAPIFVHIRRGLAGDPSGLSEVLTLAEQTGAPVHICHLQHSAMGGTANFLAMLRDARKRGVDVTTEMFPYNAGTTVISAAVFSRDWQSIFNVGYDDLEWAATGERFTKETWEEKRRNEPDGGVINHYVKPQWTRLALTEPGVMIVTDGIPVVSEEVNVPPQGIGSYSRVLGRYVREQNALDLATALAKMSLLPAKRLEAVAPAFKRKGRLRVGADADIVVFDPETIIDRSTYQDPYQTSEGVHYLLVGGEVVVRDQEFIEGNMPGSLITSLLK